MKNYIHDFAIFIFNHSECVRYFLSSGSLSSSSFYYYSNTIFPFCRVLTYLILLSEIGVNVFPSSRLQYVFTTISAQYECGIRGGINEMGYMMHMQYVSANQTPVECTKINKIYWVRKKIKRKLIIK